MRRHEGGVYTRRKESPLRRIPALCMAVVILTTMALLPPGGALQNVRSGGAITPNYSIQAIRYASAPDDVANLVMGAPKEKITIAMVVWLIRGGGRNILFDSGYHRDTFLKDFPSTEYIRPDQISDVIISHSHWDHLGGIDLFPKATVWIQKEEFRYYTGEAWQPGGNHGGIDPADVQELVKLNTEGQVRFVEGDNVEIFPGIQAYTGGHHTYASQYLRVDGNPPFVLASDNVYLYRNLAEHRASATFGKADEAANIQNQVRMVQLAGGSPDRVIPGHDAAQFGKYPTSADDRVARIK